MEPETMFETDWLEVESVRFGTWWVLAEHAPHWPIPTDVEVPRDFISPEVLEEILQFTEIPAPGDVDYVKLIRGYGARLNMPGYLDCTPGAVFKTLREARDYLKDIEDY